MYDYVVEYQIREHSTAQSNHPCTKQQTKYVPIRVRIKKSMYVHVCGVGVVFLEHGALRCAKRLVHLTFSVSSTSFSGNMM